MCLVGLGPGGLTGAVVSITVSSVPGRDMDKSGLCIEESATLRSIVWLLSHLQNSSGFKHENLAG